MKKNIIIFLAFMLSGFVGISQTDANNELKPFYSFYLHKKLNYRWSIDNYSVFSMKSFQHDFWLAQFNFGANYRINRLYTFSFGYGIAFYKYGNAAWWDRHYPDVSPNFMNTVGFNSLNLMIKRDDNIGNKFKLSNRFIIQRYFPKFEKYQTRLQYNVKFSYRKNDLPARLKPFVQGALYYYRKGVPVDYYDENFNVVETSAPNGLHRYRFKLGTSINPLKKNSRLRFVLYFALNREFNVSWLGNDLNTPRPSSTGNTIFTTYKFNNYNILGFQVNYFFK